MHKGVLQLPDGVPQLSLAKDYDRMLGFSLPAKKQTTSKRLRLASAKKLGAPIESASLDIEAILEGRRLELPSAPHIVHAAQAEPLPLCDQPQHMEEDIPRTSAPNAKRRRAPIQHDAKEEDGRSKEGDDGGHGSDGGSEATEQDSSEDSDAAEDGAGGNSDKEAPELEASPMRK